jgi:hypothetical protein
VVCLLDCMFVRIWYYDSLYSECSDVIDYGLFSAVGHCMCSGQLLWEDV